MQTLNSVWVIKLLFHICFSLLLLLLSFYFCFPYAIKFLYYIFRFIYSITFDAKNNIIFPFLFCFVFWIFFLVLTFNCLTCHLSVSVQSLIKNRSHNKKKTYQSNEQMLKTKNVKFLWKKLFVHILCLFRKK